MSVTPVSAPAEIADTGAASPSAAVPLDPEQAAAAEAEAKAAQKVEDDKVLAIARERLMVAEEAETDIRRLALEDLQFRAGNQWPDNVKQDRDRDGRPCLVINRLPQLVQQVTNNQRQNRPSIKVHAVGDGADEETAKIIQGHIRHIEAASNADHAYDTASEGQVVSGLGYFRLTTDYAAPDSFDQEIFIKRIRDPFSVSFDPFSQEPDGSDAQWCFVSEFYSQDQYKDKWPDSELGSDWSILDRLGSDKPIWMRDNAARVVEYFSIEKEDRLIHLLSTGETVDDEKLLARLDDAHAAGIQCSVERSRITKIPVVHWRTHTATEILDHTIFPGSFVPIIPVYGAELFINGKRVLEGLVRHAKDPQRTLNYWKSAQTEAIALAPRAPFIGAEGQFEGHQDEWKQANRKNFAYLEYKATAINGTPVPPPQRQAFEPAVAAITGAAMQASDDIKGTTGIYDAGTGDQSNEVSGVAINSRAGQIATSNFHFYDNLTRSIKHAGRIIVEILPKVYDTARSARILGEDGSQKTVMFNAPFKDENGKEQLYSLDAGRYGVTVDTGPSFASKRQEAAASMIAFTAKLPPQQAQGCADLVAKNMDWPGAQDIADRLRKMLPPELQDNGAQAQVPPQAMAMIQQQHAHIQQIEAKLNEYTKIIETKAMDLQHRERVEIMKLDVDKARIQADIEIALAKLGTQSSIALLQEEVATLKHQSEMDAKRLDLIGINQPIQAPSDFDPEQADGGNYAGFGHVGSGPAGGQSPGNPTGGDLPGTPMESEEP